MKNKLTEPYLFIVIVNWQNWEDTIECARSIEQNDYKNYHVIIVDNSSENESYEKLKEWCFGKQHYHLLQTGKNLGFAGGANIGIKYAKNENANYILLLNNDTIATPTFLENLINAAEKDKESGIFGCTILHYSSKKVWYREGKISWLRGGGYHPGKGKSPRAMNGKRGTIRTDFITGCFMLIESNVFDKIGLMDESYFLYNEDADYCLKAANRGIKMAVVPEAVIYHKENSTVGGWKPYHIYYLIRNKLIFMKKYAPNGALLSVFYFVITLAGVSYSLVWLIKGRFDLIEAYIKGVRDFLRS